MGSGSLQFPILAMIMIVIGGACISLQAPVNAGLARGIGSPLVASAISFGVGFVILTVVSVIRGEVPSFSAALTQPWWMLIGGAFGAFYVWSMVWSLPRLGVVTAIAVLALGQIVAAMVLDRIGAFGLPVRDISVPRILSALMVLGGVLLSRY